ncbi:MAG TPA: cyclopropane-fatty-acyl-phospholipid synthase family protein, partial [Polyangiaceae bacterium]|nr:cyclopropane-fatty-acyl-phospholipid synthase family protein [Polyangiaceae bacterium]
SMRLLERNLVPDWLIRRGIRKLLAQRLREENMGNPEAQQKRLMDLIARLKASPIAVNTIDANIQHYEVPTEFYLNVLGPNLKYSSCYYESPEESLEVAEERMLALTGERARLADGQRVLELGCGWGSLTLWMARKFPNSAITGVSNSSSQRALILRRARELALDNVSIVTADINRFEPASAFDRVVSVEMFEHVRNWEALLGRVRGWLAPEGLVFLHFFAHRSFSYPFEAASDDDWMGKHFFTGGMMPSSGILSELSMPFDIAGEWQVGGEHYARTAEAWLANLDRNATALTGLFERDLGEPAAARQIQRWRLFFLACAELFGFEGGREWLVQHALLRPKAGIL